MACNAQGPNAGTPPPGNPAPGGPAAIPCAMIAPAIDSIAPASAASRIAAPRSIDRHPDDGRRLGRGILGGVGQGRPQRLARLAGLGHLGCEAE